jgi:tetratricopeptide (TPR) repeat protein
MQPYPPGTRIGQYEIASRPMMGGMGVVYFALDHDNDSRPVALKTFRPELLADRAARDRFLREGTAWVELGSHPHIVRCYSVEYYDPIAFLVLELIAKEQNMPDASLRSWLIPGRPLTIEQALLFALQIARGMQHATEKIPGFVHRDLKPENILVGADQLPDTNINRLRVTDFGLVKAVANSDSTSSSTKAKELRPNQVQFTRGAGTPLYMAPEQWKGESVDVYTDVYVFGCILYEMLSGQCAADGKTINELQASHCNGKLRLIAANLPKNIAMLITKCLRLNSADRYGTWNEIIANLEHVIVAQSGKAAPRIDASAEMTREEQIQNGWSYNTIGHAFIDLGKTDLAASYFKKALVLARETGDRREEGAALSNLGNAHTALGDVRQAINYHEEALAIAREIGDRYGECGALSNLGTAYTVLGKARQAIEYLEQTLRICHEIGERHTEAATLSNLGDAYAALGDVRRAIECYKQTLAVVREIGDLRGESIAVNNLGNAYTVLGEAQQAIEYLEQTLRICREISDRRREAYVLVGLGRAYLGIGDEWGAIEYYKESLAIMREIEDRSGEGTILGNLGIAYFQLKDMRVAMAYFEQSLIIAREISDRREEGDSLGNLGSVHANLGNVEQAIGYYEQALAIARAIEDMDAVARHLFNLAILSDRQGDTARVLPLAQESLRIYTRIGQIPNAHRVQQFITQVQDNESGFKPDDPVLAAFEAFQRASSQQNMQSTVSRYPFITDESFIQELEQVLEQQVPPELKPAFAQRLVWLKQIGKK